MIVHTWYNPYPSMYFNSKTNQINLIIIITINNEISNIKFVINKGKFSLLYS